VRLTTEYAYEGRWDPVMTWTVESLVQGGLEDRHFGVPAPWAADPRASCRWNMGGWPQLHIWSHYLRV
jgi:hypothetical protein